MKPGPTIVVLATVAETLEGFFVPQLRSLHRAGFDVHVVSSPGPAFDRLSLPEGVQRHALPIERAPHPLRDVVSLWRLYWLIRRIRPQIVHAHTPKAGLLGMAAAMLARIPLRLYTVHGLPLLTRTGMRRRILAAAERTSAWFATHCYSVSESVRRVLAEEKLNRRAVVLGNGSCGGVDVELFQPRPGEREAARGRYGLPAGAIVLTFLGRLAQDKGIGVLAEAWPDLADQFAQAHLLLAGEPDRSDPVPDAVLETLRAHPRVHWIGHVLKEQVPWVYAATDMLVLPTFREGLSQVALEAGAAGIPVISCRVTGLDAVVDGVTGILVAPGDPAALREGMARLVVDPALRQRLGEAARAHIVARFSETQVNGLWLAEYLLLTGSPDGRGCPEPVTAALAAGTGIQKRSHSAS